MMSRPLRRALTATALALISAASAQAGYIVGSWDPPFGQPFGSLGWSGEIKLVFSDDSLGTCATGINSFGCTPIVVDYARVNFYDLASPQQVVDTLDFKNQLVLTSIVLDTGRHFAGFSARAAGALQSSETAGLTRLGSENAWFGLVFDWTGTVTVADLLYTNNPTACNGEAPSDDCFVGNNSGTNHGSSQSSPQLALTAYGGAAVSQVPEPAGLLLVVTALAGLGLARRAATAKAVPNP